LYSFSLPFIFFCLAAVIQQLYPKFWIEKNSYMVFTIGSSNSIANHFLQALRDPTLQQDRARFRRNIERLGEIMAYEISKKLNYQSARIQTPLGQVDTHLLNEKPVLITVLRAGLPYFKVLSNLFLVQNKLEDWVWRTKQIKKSGNTQKKKILASLLLILIFTTLVCFTAIHPK
jgi:hypothetical protein